MKHTNYAHLLAAFARLIAAAPELLAALDGLLPIADRVCLDLPYEDRQRRIAAAKAAIAKAKG